MTPAEYVRAIEQHVCRKNDGHLIRVVGPGFEVVSRWERDGVPLKVALRGIDRYFERYYRNGPKRRPVRVEFCDTDVLEVYDEWRRAVGVGAGVRTRTGTETGTAAGSDAGVAGDAPERTGSGHGPSLSAHLARVLTKLSSARATGRLGPEADALIDRVSAELDEARAHARGVRGAARRALLDRLNAIDLALVEAVLRAMPAQEQASVRQEAREELSAYRTSMDPEAYARAERAVGDRLVRERAGLPIVGLP